MYVYKITNAANGMSYIGATLQPLERRLGDHFSRARNNRSSLLHVAIREFGEDNFSVKILCYARNSEELMMLEMKAIREHGTLTPAGYNMTTGGKGTMDRRQLESTKLLISKKATGRVVTDEVKAKLSAALKGKPQPWNSGPTGLPAWNRGKPSSDEARRKMALAKREFLDKHPTPIEMYGVVYKSIADAVRQSGFSRMQVKYRLRTGRARYLYEQKHTGTTPTNAKAVELNGVTYKTISDAARSSAKWHQALFGDISVPVAPGTSTRPKRALRKTTMIRKLKQYSVAFLLCAFALGPAATHAQAQTALSSTTLNGSITASTDHFNVTSGSGMAAVVNAGPAIGGIGDPSTLASYVLYLDTEAVIIRGISGNTITVAAARSARASPKPTIPAFVSGLDLRRPSPPSIRKVPAPSC